MNDTDECYIQDRCAEIRKAINNRAYTDGQRLVAMNTEAIRLAMHIQDLIKKQGDKV